MPTTGEIICVTLGVSAMIVCIILFPLFALLCRHLRGRESQIRRWGPASHVLIPPCYCYLTVWTELCPCLEPRVRKFLPKDLTKKGHTHDGFVPEANGHGHGHGHGIRPKAALIRADTPDSLNFSQEIMHPPESEASFQGAETGTETESVCPHDDVISPDENSESPIVQITVASSNEDLRSIASSQVLDHGHVNMAMTLNDEPRTVYS